MSENTKTTPAQENPAEGTTPLEGGNKTFSQDDVNRIVQERLAKEKAKSETTLAEKERELAAREFKLTAKEKLETQGLPVSLVEALNTSTPEAFDAALVAISQLLNDKKEQAKIPRIVAPCNGVARDPLRDAMGLKR